MPDPIARTLERHRGRLLALPGVVGAALGERLDGAACILVLIESASRELEARLPRQLDGHPVEVRAIGRPRARPGRGPGPSGNPA